MQPQVHRKAIVISALLTAFLIVTMAGGLFLVNRFAAIPADAASDPAITPPVVGTAQPANDALQQANAALQQASIDLANRDAVIAAYDAQLQNAYVALQQAYAQIDMLQTAMNQPTRGQNGEHERDEHTLTFSQNGETDND